MHRVLLGSLSVTATASVMITPLPVLLQITIVLFILTSSLLQIRMLSTTRQLALYQEVDHSNPDIPGNVAPHEHWSVSYDGANAVTGRLITAGYRSANLLVLVLQTECGHWHRIPVWTDSLSASHFSYLTCQMAYNSSAPQLRRPHDFLFTWSVAFRACLNYTRLKLRQPDPRD